VAVGGSEVAHPAARDPVAASTIVAMCERFLGPRTVVEAMTELGWASYNSVVRVDLLDRDPVVVRVAPREAQQLRSERHWLRSEYVATPYLMRLAPLVPLLIGADFTHELIDRDYLVQSCLPGVPAPERLSTYDEAQRPAFFFQLGALSRKVHAVGGASWGPVAAPMASRWSDAIERSLIESVADLAELGLEREDVRRLATIVDSHRDRLDGIDQPRLLHGDLWTVNVLLDPAAATPTIVGVLDSERAWWGDPLSDWAMDRAEQRSLPAERDAFWTGYGEMEEQPHHSWRRLLYRARHLVAGRIEAARLGRMEHAELTVGRLAAVLSELST
jgi:aminoglycoside phosphotransferase (APT) family kinase protein